MARLGMADKLLIEDVFDMGGGYVLDFSNPTFARFSWARWVSISIRGCISHPGTCQKFCVRGQNF